MRMKNNKKIGIISFLIVLLLPFSLIFPQSEEALKVLEKNKNSVVSFVSLGEDKEVICRGTGFVISNGIMATNYHLVSQAKNVEGVNFKGKNVKVEGIVTVDKNLDIAFLKIKSKALSLPFSESNEFEAGKNIFTIGGNESGEIKVVDGTIGELLEYAPNQKIIDTTLNPPDSFCGGPVLDSNGQVLGMIVFLDNVEKFVFPVRVLMGLQKGSTVTKFKNWEQEDYFSTLEGSYFAGKIYYALDNTGKSEKYLKKVIEQNPKDINAYILLASINVKQRYYSAAVTNYEKIIELDPNMNSAYFGLGIVYINMMKWKDAIPQLEKAVQLNLNNNEAYFQIGSAYEALRDFEKAAEAYKNYVKSEPKNPGTGYYNLAICQIELKQFAEAIASFQEALKEKPNDLVINQKLAQACKNAGQYEKAAGIYTNLSEINPENTKIYLNNIIKMYDEANMADKAIESTNRLIELDPEDADAIYNLGYMYVKLNKYSEAVEPFKRAIEIKPDFKYAYSNLGFCYSKLKKYKDFIAVYKKLVEIDPEDADGWLSIGIGYMYLKNFSSAAEPIEKAVELRPDHAVSLYNLAIVYLNLHDNYSARKIYGKLKEVDPNLASKLQKLLR